MTYECNVPKKKKEKIIIFILIMRRATTQHTWFLPQETRFGQVVISPPLSLKGPKSRNMFELSVEKVKERKVQTTRLNWKNKRHENYYYYYFILWIKIVFLLYM